MEISEHLWRIVGAKNTTMVIPVRNTSIPTPLINRQTCFHQKSFSRGVWHGDNPLDYKLPLMMLQIIILFLLSAALQRLLRPFRQSRFICNVLAGIILGPSVLGRDKKLSALMFPSEGNYIIVVVSLIGGIYFAFLTSVKTETSLLMKTARTSWIIALIGLVSPCCAVFALLYALNLKFHAPFFSVSVATSLSYTYFTVVACTLHELNLITSEVGQLALSLAMVCDAVNLVVVVVVTAVREEALLHSLGVLVSFIAFVGVSVFAIRPAVLMIVRNTPKGRPVKEFYIVAIYVAVLAMAVFSNLIGLPIVYGGLVLGFVIPAGPPLGSALIERAETVVTEVLLQLMYASVGIETNIYSVKDWRLFLAFQLVVFAACCAKFLGTLLAAVYSNILLKKAILLSFIMCFKGIIELYVYRRWLNSQLIDNQIFTQLVLSMLGTIMIITPIIDISYKPHQPIGQKGIRSIQRCCNDSEFRVISCIHTQDNVGSIVSVLQGSNPTEASPLSVYVIHLIELVGRAAPLLVRHDKQSRRSKNGNWINSDYIMRAFENFTKNSSGPVVIHPYVLIAPYRSMPDCISRLAMDNLIPFVIVPFHENQRLVVDNQAISSMRHFNTSLQSSAPCTVGILVDRSLSSCHLKPEILSHRVAVIFIGGVDDREALAFASRMSGLSAVHITVIQFITNEKDKKHYDEERKQDEFLMDEFKLKNRSNPRVEVREIVADDTTMLINSLRSMENSCDLMIVGRRQENALTVDEEISSFVEIAELGLIGDMLASSDICGGEASVLVMHHAFPVDGDHQATFSEDSGKSLMPPELQKSNGG